MREHDAVVDAVETSPTQHERAVKSGSGDISVSTNTVINGRGGLGPGPERGGDAGGELAEVAILLLTGLRVGRQVAQEPAESLVLRVWTYSWAAPGACEVTR
ncbi:hypothetical protein PV367_12855 [Streptomyces europaeiscabiei]|uniref:Uncharacterized protein n=1 Tax=Streptomyces europaeiscabiei TaxID=146819 RepID=A0AAJ2PNY5_9ACTN|nr:hypothetical protein [Streptomyces europaeiscabiei]MDX3130659.1 hypothetical protein [Streptomyces europaeiscabiei]